MTIPSPSTTHRQKTNVDVAIIGGGVIGVALARQLLLSSCTASRSCDPAPPTVALLEALPAVLCGASAGNSAMIHCGFDCTTGTLEHSMVVRGHQLFTEYAAQCSRRGLYLPWVPSGAIMLAMSDEEMHIIQSDILPKAVANGVKNTTLLSTRASVVALEPHVHGSVVGGLHVPSEWIVDPWQYPALLLAEAATAPGFSVLPSCRITRVERRPHGYHLFDQNGQYRVTARIVVNCAGLKGDVVEALLHNSPLPFLSTNSPTPLSFELFPRLGRFIQFGPAAAPLVQRALLPIPTQKTKGIIVFRTVYGQVFVGPTAEDPDEPRAPQTVVVQSLRLAAESKVPSLMSVPVVAAYAGARPALRQRQDYLVDVDSRSIDWFTVAGVRSTGLTSSLALAELIAPHILQRLRVSTTAGESDQATERSVRAVAPPLPPAPIINLPSADAVTASLCSLLRPGGPLSYERRHHISSEGCPHPSKL
jgi:glycerol-3-phosphate dehydrogenase